MEKDANYTQLLLARIGVALGVCMGIGGMTGTLFGGYIGENFGQKSIADLSMAVLGLVGVLFVSGLYFTLKGIINGK